MVNHPHRSKRRGSNTVRMAGQFSSRTTIRSTAEANALRKLAEGLEECARLGCLPALFKPGSAAVILGDLKVARERPELFPNGPREAE